MIAKAIAAPSGTPIEARTAFDTGARPAHSMAIVTAVGTPAATIQRAE
jgi:hypothetical protein